MNGELTPRQEMPSRRPERSGGVAVSRLQAAKSVAIIARLPGTELVGGKRIAGAGVLKCQNATSHGSYDLCLAPRNPTNGACWRKIVRLRRPVGEGTFLFAFSVRSIKGALRVSTRCRPLHVPRHLLGRLNRVLAKGSTALLRES